MTHTLLQIYIYRLLTTFCKSGINKLELQEEGVSLHSEYTEVTEVVPFNFGPSLCIDGSNKL